MRILTIVFIILAICLIGYNVTKVDVSAPFKGDSMVAIIGIAAAACAILILIIFNISKKIQQRIKDKA